MNASQSATDLLQYNIFKSYEHPEPLPQPSSGASDTENDSLDVSLIPFNTEKMTGQQDTSMVVNHNDGSPGFVSNPKALVLLESECQELQRTIQLDDEDDEEPLNSCQSRNHHTQGASNLINNNSEYFSFSKNEKAPSIAYNSLRGSTQGVNQLMRTSGELVFNVAGNGPYNRHQMAVSN
jgi:hypothetical protein